MFRILENLMIYIYIFIVFHFFKIVRSECQFQKHNFEILSTNSPWLVWNYPHGRLEISLCKSFIGNCEQNVPICYMGDGIFVNFDNRSVVSGVQKTEQFTLQIKGNNCSTENESIVVIYFKCGKSLGFPKFLTKDACRIILEWQTTAACKEGSELARMETAKCYGSNSQQLFINLDTLDDEYEVEVGGDDDDNEDDDDDGIENIKGAILKLAVCRNMHSGESCPGVGACLMKNGTVFSLGKISKEVLVTRNDSLTITYFDGESSMPGCKEFTTTINFMCPERGIGSKPLLLPSPRCNFAIKWETESACPVQATTTNSSCFLRSNKHIIDFTSLGNESVKVMTEDKKGDLVEYELNICSDKLVACGESHSSACQTNLNNSNIKSIGNFSKQIFRYSDGTLQMTMDGGDPCGTGFYRNTFINFQCDANKSLVSFDYEDMCTYVFTWKTPVACLTPSISCTLKSQGLNFDLSGLIKTDAEENWKTTDNSFVLNVCRGLAPSDPLARNCSFSAICQKDGNKFTNYGRRMQGLTFNKERSAIQLQYFDGDICGTDKRFNASLLLFCDPNVANSQPYVAGKSSDGCRVDLEWHSSSACGSGHVTGRNCVLEDLMTGLHFDLSPLRFSNDSWYKVTTLEYDYFVNICGPLKNTPCSGTDVGVCQVSKKNDRIVHSTGRWSDELHYANGILRLAYKNGDDYNSVPPVPRHTDIEFVCNSGAGTGEPLFVRETNRTYKFLWHTTLACSRNSDECSSFVIDGKTFDLTFLVQQGSRQNWQMMTSWAGKSYKLLLNLCRGLLIGPETKSCDALNSACLIPLDNSESMSLGRLLRKPVVKSHAVVLTYERGSRCIRDPSSYYSLKLNLHCSETNAQSNPSSFNETSPCEFEIHWYTNSACAVVDDTHENNDTHDFFENDDCILLLDRSGQTFDITKFRGQTFNATHNLDSYKVSICGESSECGPGMVACKKDGQKVKEFVMTNGRKLSLNAHGSPQLQLESEKVKMLVHFKCNLSVTDEGLAFLEARSDWLLFSFETPSACFGRTASCRAFDEAGNEYDLEPLAKLKGSWRAFNPFKDFCDFNLCRPLLSSDEPSCRSAGSCLRKRTGEAMNGGRITNGLEVTSEGSPRILYSGGEICRSGRRSTLIMLKCSTAAHEPLLLTDVEDCESLIQWETPFACPNKILNSVGNDCRVKHPKYASQTFDLSRLKESKDYEIDFDIGNYLIRVCKEIQNNERCKDMKAGACLVSAGKAFDMGTFNDRLEYRDGKLILVYSTTGDAKASTRLDGCEGGVSTEIEFKCEHDNLGISSGPVYTSGSCHRKFEWVTSFACFKYRRVECRVEDANGTIYDLSPLILHNSNYEVKIDGGETTFVINVCTTLVLTGGSSCPPNSAACRIKSGKSSSIGTLPGEDEAGRKMALSAEGGKAKLVYEGDGGTSTVIYFACDPRAPETSTPQFLVEEGDTFVFTWKTRLVCNNNSKENLSNDCSVIDPTTGHLYDLSPIRGTHEFNEYGRTFTVSVCSCNRDGSCPANQSNPWLLTYEHGTIVLRYSGGQSCNEANKMSSTVVSFVCPKEGEEEVKQFDFKNENCLYVFTWKNKLACRKELKCLVREGGYNLSPLIKHEGAYDAEVSVRGVSRALVNVCSRLPVAKDCNPSAAVCIEKDGHRFVSGGSAREEPKYEEDTKEVSLTYSDGDKCSSKTWSSKIIFQCSKNSDQLNPILSSIDEVNCLFTFLWKTEFVCQASLPSSNLSLEDCKFKLDNDSYDFNNLSTNLATQKVATLKVGTIEIRLCSEFQHEVCRRSAVCLFDGTSAPIKGFGGKSDMKILKEGKDVKVTYMGGKCKDSKAFDLASLIFICDKSSTTPSTEILYESNCSIIINIRTSFACALVDSSPRHTSQALDPTPAPIPESPKTTSQTSYTVYVILAVVAVCASFIVAGALIHRKKRNQRGYEPVDTMHYSRDYEGMSSPLFQDEERNVTGLQNYASDDDLML